MKSPRNPLAASLKHPLFTCACLLLARAYTRSGAQESGPPAQISNATASGAEPSRRGETEASVNVLRAATKQNRDDAYAWHDLGLALVKHHKPKGARKAFESAVRLRAVLAADGAMRYIFAVTRLPDALMQAVLNATSRIKLIPATKDNRPVSQFVTTDYNFNIY